MDIFEIKRDEKIDFMVNYDGYFEFSIGHDSSHQCLDFILSRYEAAALIDYMKDELCSELHFQLK